MSPHDQPPKTAALLTDKDRAARHALWAEFRTRWPLHVVRAMTLQEYTNLEKKDSFTYWVEARTEKLGSIWGLNSFKFGIYRRASGETKESGTTYTYSGDYAWRTLHGSTQAEAFAAVRELIVTVAEHAAAGNFEAIDAIDLMPLYKWKLAFLYQDPSNPTVFPVYAWKALWNIYRRHVDPAAPWSVPMSVRYSTLRDRFRDVDPFDLAQLLWNENNAPAPRAQRTWAANLDLALSKAERDALLRGTEVGNQVVPQTLREWIAAQGEAARDDRLALVSGGRVRARAKLINVDENDVSWSQQRCDLAWTGAELLAGLVAVSDTIAATIWAEMPATTVVPNASADTIPAARNVVLYGPPGTGKTFATIRYALRLVLGEDAVTHMTPETAAKQFRQLQQDGRIDLVTFHQAYGYEEFVEGLRPVLAAGEGGEVQYELHPGVFKRIALRAAGAGLRLPTDEPSFEVLWLELKRRIEGEGEHFASASGAEYVLRVSPRGGFVAERVPDDGDDVVPERRQIASKHILEIWWAHRAELGPAEGLTYEKARGLIERERGGTGGHHYAPSWIVYKELLALREDLLRNRAALTRAVTDAQVQDALDKAAPGKVDFAFGPKTPQFVLVVDEINRGNVSKVLGELITLLEPDKRLGMANELKLPLAYSPNHRFAVPPNLHIVATMNTADRSIALMDVALRRRFEFEEVMPDTAALRDVLTKRSAPSAVVELVCDLLDTVNARIRFLYDRDHQIGHAYFMGAVDVPSLRRVIVDRIVPLLQEYFYGRWDKVSAVLGCPYDEHGRPLRTGAVLDGKRYRAPIIEASSATAARVLGFTSDHHEDTIEHQLAAPLRSLSTSNAELVPYFLCVLELDAGDHASRSAALLDAVARA